jgi:hypothetical protein
VGRHIAPLGQKNTSQLFTELRILRVFEEFWSLARSLIQGTVDTGFVGPLNSKNPAYRVPLPTTGDMELEEGWIFFADILPNRNRI